jgi:Flp pilus assembly protein CpaB
VLGFAITLLTFSQLHPAGPPTVTVVVATHDLASGTVLSAGDLAVRQVTADSVPPDAFTQIGTAVHHPLVTALFSGEVVGQRDVLDPHLIEQIGAGLVAVPVHVTPAAAAVVQRGDHVDVLAGASDAAQQSSSGAVASDVLVLIPSLGSATSSVLGASNSSSGADVVVIARPSQAAAIASVNGQTTLVLALRGSSP